MNDEMKRCCRCGETKPRSEFSKNRSRKDGLKDECKSCSREMDARWAAENPEKVRARNERNNPRNNVKPYKRAHRKLNEALKRSRERWFRWDDSIPLAEVAAFWGVECWPHKPTIEAVAKIVEAMGPDDELDHIIPINAGGSPIDRANLQVLSKEEHREKRWFEREMYQRNERKVA